MMLRPSSIRVRLVTWLLGLQIVVLLLAAVMGGLLVIRLRYISTQAEIVQIVASSVSRSGDGALEFREQPRLASLIATYPNFGFIVRDTQGQMLSQGAVPERFARAGLALEASDVVEISGNPGSTGPPIRIEWATGSAGLLQVIVAIPASALWSQFETTTITTVAFIVLPLTALLVIAAIIGTPLVVRRSLRGLEEAAISAELINVDRRQQRLAIDGVPAEVVPLVRAVNRSLDRLDEGARQRDRFLVDAAHELRTPIAILNTRIESMALGSAGDLLLLDVARLSNLADQLLDLQRLQRSPDAFVEVDLVTLSRSVAADLAPLAIASGYDLAFTGDELDIHVKGDRGALERVLVNLLQNAIRYGGGGGTIRVLVTKPASVAVCDDGPGIPVDERERVLQPFYRLAAGEGGTGLGLHMVDEIVRLHGGAVAIGSGPGGGACVKIDLPAA